MNYLGGEFYTSNLVFKATDDALVYEIDQECVPSPQQLEELSNWLERNNCGFLWSRNKIRLNGKRAVAWFLLSWK
jgi:hypothetical protein